MGRPSARLSRRPRLVAEPGPSNEHHNPAAWWLHAPEAKSYGELPLAAPCSRWLAVAKQFVADSLLEDPYAGITGKSLRLTGNFIG